MFLDATRRLNPQLLDTAARLHAEGRVPAGCYVVDLDAVASNAARVAAAARAEGLQCLQMTKQFGRNPLVAETIAAGGIEAVVAVELAEARVLHERGLRIGHLGHLVQVPRHELHEAIAMQPGHLTVFGVEQARAAGAAAVRVGTVQPLLLRVVGENDVSFEAQRGGVGLAEVIQAAEAIADVAGVRLEGVTSFPCMSWDEAAGTASATPNLATLRAARDALRGAGFEIPVLNAPGVSCIATFAAAAAGGATHVEPGSALIGETPAHASGNGPEIPAMVYVSEVMHRLDDVVYTLGGGFYARSRARSALVYDGEPWTADVLPMPPAEIDYYGALQAAGRSVTIGASVVYAFRSQVFTTRAPVAVVTGIGGGAPEVAGLFTRDGRPL
jgi:predicted amino acid racemase